MLAIAIGTQFGSFLLAALSLEQVMVERKDELRAIPIDKEVFEVEETFKRRRKAYREVTKWENLSRLNKIILSWALSCMIVCVYLVQLFQSLCFREFELSSKIEDDLGGDWKRIVLPFGWVVLALLFVSCVLLTIFICNARRKANSSSVKSGKTISNSVTVQTKGGATTSGVGISSSDISVLSDSSSVHSGVTVQSREGTTISGVGNSSISVLSNSSSVNSGVIINEEESSYFNSGSFIRDSSHSTAQSSIVDTPKARKNIANDGTFADKVVEIPRETVAVSDITASDNIRNSDGLSQSTA